MQTGIVKNRSRDYSESRETGLKTREAAVSGMRAILPAAASLHNPVDMLASAMPEHYAECLRLLLADPGVDSVMVITPPPPTSTAGW